MQEKIDIFIAFSEEDLAFLKELKNHLKPLEQQGLAQVWDASQVVGGTSRQQAVDSHLASAAIILLLISADFMASTPSYELAKRALARSAPPRVFVIPVLLHEVDWESSEFGVFAPLPANGKPISSWPRRDSAYTEIAKSIRAIIPEIKKAANSPAATATSSSAHPRVQTPPDVAPPARRRDAFFDVFLCYHTKDKAEVREIAQRLRARGIRPWFDEWELQPGLPWQRALEQQIGQIQSAAVFVGANSLGPWQQVESDAFLREFTRRGCPVIPVLLASAQDRPALPPFLAGMAWIDFRTLQPDPMRQLIWGITGKKPALE